MSLVAHGLLGLLEDRPKHGYELRRSFDERLAGSRPLRSGQVYSTLGRLERDGRVDEVGGEQGPGPERRLYAITKAGIAELERWLATPEAPEQYLQSVVYAKVVVALSSHDDADTRQRAMHCGFDGYYVKPVRSAGVGRACARRGDDTRRGHGHTRSSAVVRQP